MASPGFHSPPCSPFVIRDLICRYSGLKVAARAGRGRVWIRTGLLSGPELASTLSYLI